MFKKLGIFAAMTGLVIAMVPGVASADEAMTEEPPSIVEIVATTGQYKTLLRAVVEAGLVDAVAGLDDVTVFAPDNRAFRTTAKGFDTNTAGMIDYLSSAGLLDDVLLYHVVPGVVPSSVAVTIDGYVPTLQGESIYLDGPALTLNGNVTLNTKRLDIFASNGVIHGINGVLVPPSILP